MTRQRIWGPVFLAPALILLFLLYIVPFFYSMRLSLYDVGFVEDTWLGLGNYRALLKEGGFWGAIRVTGKFAIAYLFGSLMVAYALGLALRKFGERFCGSILVLYRIPTIFSAMSAVVAWRWFYRYPGGGLNRLLGFFGISGTSWLGNPDTAVWAICLVMAGLLIGGPTLLYVIAIGQIDEEMLEAARMDGASEFQLIRHIITPLTHRVRLFLLLTNLIGALNIWEHPFFYTSGGPLGSTTTVMYKIYHKALVEGDLGGGSALTTISASATLLMAFAVVKYFRDILG